MLQDRSLGTEQTKSNNLSSQRVRIRAHSYAQQQPTF